MELCGFGVQWVGVLGPMILEFRALGLQSSDLST